MWIAMDQTFRDERKKFDLRLCCEHCAYFSEESSKCAMLYPPEPHRAKSLEEAQDQDRIYFCKMFEVDDA
jgi:hypothetical protein